MRYFTNFNRRLIAHMQLALCAFICTCLLSSCVDKKEEFTDVYYIHNELEEPISLVLQMSVYWDTCSTYSIQNNTRVWFSKEEVVIPTHTTIRLHPISRRNILPEAHQPDIASLLGYRTKLIIGSDTIVFNSAVRQSPPAIFPAMFTDDSIFSIYNTMCWQTVQASDMPNTYYHTFSITTKNLEGREDL